MKPPPFAYVRPANVGEALGLLASVEDPRLLAGGQSLLPMMNMRLARAGTVVDLGDLHRLRRVLVHDSRVLVGAMCRHADLAGSAALARPLPILRQVVDHIGHPAIRNRGTLGGSLAHADPAAELPALMVLAGATLWAESLRSGRRAIPAEAFVRGHYLTALELDEMLTWIEIPQGRPHSGFGFHEYAPRAGDFAEVGAVVRVDAGDGHAPLRVRAVTIGIGDRPHVLSDDAPDASAGQRQWCAESARRLVGSLGTAVDDAIEARLLEVCLARALEHAAAGSEAS